MTPRFDAAMPECPREPLAESPRLTHSSELPHRPSHAAVVPTPPIPPRKKEVSGGLPADFPRTRRPALPLSERQICLSTCAYSHRTPPCDLSPNRALRTLGALR